MFTELILCGVKTDIAICVLICVILTTFYKLRVMFGELQMGSFSRIPTGEKLHQFSRSVRLVVRHWWFRYGSTRIKGICTE